MESEFKGRILVTGASGFIACHAINLLLERNYFVFGTVRSLQNPKKVDPIYKINPEKKQNLELKEINLLDPPEKWNELLKEINVDGVLHIASPFVVTAPKNEDELIKPAVAGTQNVLNACLANNVKKVVLTSSVASIYAGHENKLSFDENDWSIVEKCDTYSKSKTLAEKAAWEIWKNNQGKIQLTTINPGFVFGPTFTETQFTSADFIANPIKGETKAIPKLGFNIVDVRDVALAHIRALEGDHDGERFILVSTPIFYTEICDILREEFKGRYNVTSKTIGYCPLKCASFFKKEVKAILPMVNKKMIMKNEKSIEKLKIEYRPAKESLIDMANDLISKGYIPPPKKT